MSGSIDESGEGRRRFVDRAGRVPKTIPNLFRKDAPSRHCRPS